VLLSGLHTTVAAISTKLNAVRLKESDFDTVRVLGRGGFGEVCAS